MTLTTTFINKTTFDIKLKEGNAGVYRELTILKGLPTEDAEPTADNRLVQEFDERSTYREFKVATVSRSRSRIHITSDFILDNAVINMVPNPQRPEGFEVKGDPRSSVRSDSSPLAIFSFIWSKLRRK
ncbi:hypothetical protein KC19_8G072700 [Ceratodon purpureus]|uniref:DUF7748 domain-containing protein n=1 Tax=Ceratodon purpureus TaxID=3225 RepID=A0A8T0H0T7_CERPU|nr:hypothetical protein KC19_8G072700 [Ceratodon purpureus]